MRSQNGRARTIFLDALEIAFAQDRADYIRQQCGGDQRLIDEVEELLRHHSQVGGFLETPAVGPTVQLEEFKEFGGDDLGSWIGVYQLVERLGEGGMAVVYLAQQQEPVRRKVALKTIRPGTLTRQVIARFEMERQALALMNHPNIAKVLDAGTTDTGRPFFVMELVDGQSVTDYCDADSLSIRERLQLFRTICDAVDHAHDQGVIHRDIKPSNVLVTVRNGEPTPKIIDFGIAKATQRSLKDATAVTQTGQFVGTPQYMSPEQADMSPLEIGPRSDIYSLGVLLYELLTGTTPFDPDRLLSVGLDEMRRTMREVDPPRPSARLRSLGDTVAEVASHRDTHPGALNRLVAGDLDWITLKALEKDPEERYATASELADDIERFLENMPILARRPTLAKHLAKWTQRHRAIAVSGILLLAFSIALLAVSNLYIRRQKAETEEQLWIATSLRLAAQSKSVRDETPIQRLLLAVEATQVPRRHGKRVPPLARESLLEALSDTGGRPLLCEGIPLAAPGPAFSPGGQWMATSCQGEVRLWDLAKPWSSKIILQGQEATEIVWAVSSGGRWIVTSESFEQSRDLRLWDLAAEGRLTVLAGHTDWGNAPRFSPDGRWFAAGSPDATVRVWDLTAEDPVGAAKVLRGREEQKVRPRAFSPDGRWLATGGGSAQARLWDLAAKDPNETSVALPMKEHESGLVVAFSPDGRWLATGSSVHGADRSAAVKLWDLTVDDPAAAPIKLPGDSVETEDVLFSPDGRWLVSAGLDSTAHLWDLTAADPASTHLVLHGHTWGIWDVAISPDSRWLVTAGADKIARVWNLTAEDPSAVSMVLRGHESRIMKAAFTTDSQRVITWSTDGAARIWNISPGVYGLANTGGLANKTFELPTTPQLLWQQPTARRVWMIDDGAKFLTDSFSGEGRLWDVSSSDPWRSAVRFSTSDVTGEDSSSGSLRPSRDGRWVWCVTGKDAVLWDLRAEDPASSGKKLPGQPIQGWGPGGLTGNGRWLFRATFGDFVHKPGVLQLASSPDGGWLTAPNWDCSITLWDLHTKNSACSPLVLRGENRGPRPKFNDTRVWDLQAPDPAASSMVLRGHSGDITASVFSPDGRWLATASVDRTIRLWDMHAQDSAAQPHVLHGPQDSIRQLWFSADGRWLTSQSPSKHGPSVHLWDLSDREPYARPFHLPGEGFPRQFPPDLPPFSPNGRWLRTASGEGPVRLWDLTAEDPSAAPRVLRGHVGTPMASAFSPDGRWLATGGARAVNDPSILRDETVRLWDLSSPDTGIGCVVLRGYASRCAAVTFTADSHHLVTRCQNGEVRVWELRLDKLIHLARRAAGRQLTPEEREMFLLPTIPARE